MSSKTGADPRPWSLALRLTVWYAGSAFALIFAATGYLYLALARQIADEDDEWLAGKVGEVLRAAEERPDDPLALRRLVEAGGGRAAERILVRVDDARGPAPVGIETPGLSAAVPLSAFPGGPAGVGDFRSADGRLFRLRTEADPAGAVAVRAAMDRTEDVVLLERHRRRLAYVLGLSLVTCTAGGYRLARRGLRPVAAITATAQRIRATTLDERIDLRGLPAELRALGETFNGMLDRLRDSFARLEQFSADIAHELRTPVNNLRGESEVALVRARTPEEYREVLGSCLEECGRLTRTIDSLLFLARSESPRTHLRREQLAVARELEAVREFFEGTAVDAGVALRVEAPVGLAAWADRTLWQRAVSNLVANALAHTPAGGSVTVSARADAGGTVIQVADTGCGIAPGHLPYLFDRFYRADRARTAREKGGGVGLGLAIVRRVAELHDGTAEVESEVGRGTRVRLRFPGNPTDCGVRPAQPDPRPIPSPP